jgi:hypothetical protein
MLRPRLLRGLLLAAALGSSAAQSTAPGIRASVSYPGLQWGKGVVVDILEGMLQNFTIPPIDIVKVSGRYCDSRSAWPRSIPATAYRRFCARSLPVCNNCPLVTSILHPLPACPHCTGHAECQHLGWSGDRL